MTAIPSTAKGAARLATEEEIAREDSKYILVSDAGLTLLTDSGDIFVPNVADFGYTHPNLHRRIYLDAPYEAAPDYFTYVADMATESNSPLVTEGSVNLQGERAGSWADMTAENGTPDPAVHTYPLMPFDKDGIPYDQDIVLGVWDGLHSYRTTTTYTHDEESTTCEIP